jgi:hypothetical protein
MAQPGARIGLIAYGSVLDVAVDVRAADSSGGASIPWSRISGLVRRLVVSSPTRLRLVPNPQRIYEPDGYLTVRPFVDPFWPYE